MISYFRLTIFVTKLIFVIILISVAKQDCWAIDFDKDGYADFVLISSSQSGQLEWSAIDINDKTKRSLGQYGKLGNHLAVGNWSGDSSSSKAVISKNSNGELEWNIDLPTGSKKLIFGNSPAQVVSGLDTDGNGAIDPAIVTLGPKTLAWKIMSNPALSSSPALSELSFGSKVSMPFYANLDGKGDQIATASVNKKGVLTIRYKNLREGTVRTSTISNYNSILSAILPLSQSNGRDVVFAISKNGKHISATRIYGREKVKKLKFSGDEAVVGKYLGGNSEVLVIRNSANKATFIDSKGGKSTLPINLEGILVDDVNINAFLDSSAPALPAQPTAPPVEEPAKSKPNPICSGVPDSRQHLLYKPVSDTMGTAVLVFDSVYSTEFRAVKIELKDGTFAEGWWKGLVLWGNPDTNGPRQHWRTNVKATQIKDNALIIVDDTNQECRFMLPGSSTKRWE